MQNSLTLNYDTIAQLPELITVHVHIKDKKDGQVTVRRPTPAEWREYQKKVLNIMVQPGEKKNFKKWSRVQAKLLNLLIIEVKGCFNCSKRLIPAKIRAAWFYDIFHDEKKTSWAKT